MVVRQGPAQAAVELLYKKDIRSKILDKRNWNLKSGKAQQKLKVHSAQNCSLNIVI